MDAGNDEGKEEDYQGTGEQGTRGRGRGASGIQVTGARGQGTGGRRQGAGDRKSDGGQAFRNAQVFRKWIVH